MIKQPWSVAAEEVLKNLDSNTKGLSEKEAKSRLSKYGNNTFHNKEKRGIFSLLLKQFASPLIFLLLGSAVITIFLREWIDTGVILFAVLLNVVLGFYHEYNAENTLDKLTTYIKDRTRVMRGGVETEIDSALVVPGDILKLSYGSRVPADARIISFNNFRVDEAILTGESIPIKKDSSVYDLTCEVPERKNIVHAGTLVVEGYATAVACATGNHTEIGKIAGIVSSVKQTDTPLQKGLGHLAWVIFAVVMVMVVGILFLGLARGESFLPMLVLSSAVAVGAVPEALPIVLTVILAIGATRIAKKKGIVRKLAAAETLGSTTLIMTDKTGTLTLANMQLVGIYDTHTISKTDSHEDQKHFTKEQKELLGLSLLNIDVSVENPAAKKDDWVFQGRTFEVNIAKAAREHGIDVDQVLSSTKSLILPFNSTNKFSVSKKDHDRVVMGAPDILLERADVSKDEYIQINKWIEETSRAGKRLIGLARYKSKGDDFDVQEVKDIEFLGMFVFFDPVRKEVPKAIKNIESYGVKMVLITGDLVGTALSVARSLDWEVSEHEALSGAEIRKLSDEELKGIIPRIKIFARVTPEDKLRIGRLYQDLGEVVAMTGDGVNDSPALKAMDIGISLGSASDVAKSAADLVLLDDNFETIALAVGEGRKILGNVRKTFVYLVSNSFGEVFVIGGALLLNLAIPLTALQIIWVNLVTDSMPALAFAFDDNIETNKNEPKGLSKVFNGWIKSMTVTVGVTISLLLIALYYFLVKVVPDIEVARSIFFVCFSFYVIGITFSFRSLHKPIWSYNPFANKKLNLSLAISTILLVLTMVIPAARNVFEIAPLPASWLPFVFLWFALNLVVIEGIKYAFRTIHFRKRVQTS